MAYKNHVLLSKAEKLTADYGTRNPSYSTHHGMDFIDQKNQDQIIAIADGLVVSTQNNIAGVDHKVYTAGNYVRIRHDNGFYTRYLHMKQGSVRVKSGDRITAGTVLGTIGNTGDSYGAHVHFDVNDGEKYLDPLPYLQGKKSFYSKGEPEQEEITFNTGDEVELKSVPLYASSTISKKANTLTGKYFIHSSNIINDRIRITTPKGNSVVTGWVNIHEIKLLKHINKTFVVGDKVRVNEGAKTYNGTSLASFVYEQAYDVMQVGTNAHDDYIVIGQKGAVTAAVHANDLRSV